MRSTGQRKIMKILIELPTWLGDTVMATPAIEALLEVYPDAELTIAGSMLSVEALKDHPRVTASEVLERGWWALRRKAKTFGSFDIALSFRSSLRSAWFLLWVNAVKKCQFPKHYSGMHQVLKYHFFLQECELITTKTPGKLKLYQTPYGYPRPTLGINPGASYGSAKRWYPDSFAKVAVEMAGQYDIVIFGGPAEVAMAADIESAVRDAGVENIENLAGKTSIAQLISRIGGLSWLVTNDSGPMHIAAAYQVPTVALFGPTKHEETSQWDNKYGFWIHKKMACAPCMKRVCPLGHHECMKQISADEVIEIIRNSGRLQ